MWFIAIAALAVLLLTAVPLRLDFVWSRAQGYDNQLTFTWAGFVRIRKPLNSTQENAAESKKHAAPAKRVSRKNNRRLPRSLYSRTTISYVIECTRRLLRQTRIGPTQLTLEFGCENPADTGVLFASLVPLQLLLSRTRARVTFKPCFWQECFEPRGEGQMTLVPIRYLAVLGAIALSPRTWRLVFRLAREAKGR